MAKVTVTLRCQWDNGKEKKQPGQTVSMDEAQAGKLAGMGLVELPAPLEPKTGKAASTSRKAAAEQAASDRSQQDASDGEGLPDPDALLHESEGAEE